MSIKRIAVLTSGGDAPGMNAAIRAVVEQGIHHNVEVYGIYFGYKGLVEGDFRLLTSTDVTHNIRRGGTFLYSARFPEFQQVEYQERAVEQLKNHNIDALIVIGGDGSFQGALALSRLGFPAIGIPATIDNDIAGTEYTIGFDSAVSVALDAIDKIADTAASHNRTFFVEVMGRHAGDIAIWAGVAAGADAILIPEEEFSLENVARRTRAARNKGKDFSLIVLAEGVSDVDSFVKKYTELVPDESVRGITLSHIQRGGTPTARDRVFATLMGAKAVDLLIAGRRAVYLGITQERLAIFDIVETLKKTEHHVRQDLYQINLKLTDRGMGM